MKFTGSYKLDVKKDVVWKALNNADILKQCIPGCESFEKESDTVFNAVATNQIGPMNATFSGTVTLSNIKENQSYTLSGEGNSPVGFANGSAEVSLLEEKGSTILSYSVNVTVGGRVAQLGSRLIDGVAKKMSDYFFGRFSDIVSPINDEKKNTEKIIKKEERVTELKSNFLNKYIYSTIIAVILLIVAIIYFVSR
tara:strand:+ start:61 stop:648 length:588 start_codon:yes stop_codon:yes gene_type:complete